jgi:hypothetical protein
MDYSINERSQQVALDYLSSAKKGEISKWNRELKKFKIGDFRPTTLKWESPTSKEVDHKNQHNQTENGLQKKYFAEGKERD